MWPFSRQKPGNDDQAPAAVAGDASTEVGRLLEAWRGRTLESEDGDALTLQLNGPAAADQLRQWQEPHGLPMPAALQDLLRYTNGADFFGLELLELDAMYDYGGLIPFHNWGNGDLDCVDGDGRVHFTNHAPEIRVVVAESLCEWLRCAFDELSRDGCVRHPGDFDVAHPAPALYAHVREALKGVDCELNR